MMRRFHSFLGPLLAGFFMSVALTLAACGGGGGDAPAPAQIVVEIYGDSIMSAPGIATPPPAAIRVLRPAWVVNNHALAGSTLQQTLQGFASQPRTGRYVVLEHGGNDALILRTPAEFEADLREAIRIVRAEGRVPVLTGIVDLPGDPVFFTTPVRARMAELNAVTLVVAAELGLQHAGWREDYRGPGDVISDQIHRTQEASDRLAALVVAAVERAEASHGK